MDEDIGHTLVHYLYTGTYQTLGLLRVSGDVKRRTEYQSNIRLYCVARTYGLDGLELIAKSNISNFKEKISILDLLDIAEEAYRKLSDDEVWLTDYLTKQIKAAFKADETLFTRQCFLDHIGNVKNLDKALVKSIVEIYVDKMASMASNEEIAFEEAPCKAPCGPACEDPPAPASSDEADSYDKPARCEDLAAPACYDMPAAPACYDEPTYRTRLPCEEVAEAAMGDETISSLDGDTSAPKTCEVLMRKTMEEKKGKKAKKAKKGKKAKDRKNGTSQEIKVMGLQDISDSAPETAIQLETEPKLTPEFEPMLEPDVEEDSVCAFRAKHLLEGDMWKDCRKCRAIIHQVSLELASEGSVDKEGYEIVDGVFVE